MARDECLGGSVRERSAEMCVRTRSGDDFFRNRGNR